MYKDTINGLIIRVSDGAAIPKNDGNADYQAVLKFVADGGAIQPIDEMSLEDLKVAKNEAINRARLAANQTTFTHAGKLIACDPLSRGDIDAVANHIALFGTFPPQFPGGWKSIDNQIIPMPTIADFKAFYQSMTAQGTANFNQAQSLKQALFAAGTNTQAKIDAIQWE